MAVPEGIARLFVNINDTTVISDLSSKDAETLNQDMVGIDRPFLAKRWRVFGVIGDWPVLGSAFLMFLARSGSAPASAEIVLETTSPDIDDVDDQVEVAGHDHMIVNSIFSPQAPANGFALRSGGASANDINFDSGWIKLAAKGIPFHEELGPEIQVYNLSNVSTGAGIEFNALSILEEIWLK